jgi:hypothetical protein
MTDPVWDEVRTQSHNLRKLLKEKDDVIKEDARLRKVLEKVTRELAKVTTIKVQHRLDEMQQRIQLRNQTKLERRKKRANDLSDTLERSKSTIRKTMMEHKASSSDVFDDYDYADAFTRADVDDTGVISTENLKAFLEAEGLLFHGDIRALICAASSDASDGRLEYFEFEAALKEIRFECGKVQSPKKLKTSKHIVAGLDKISEYRRRVYEHDSAFMEYDTIARQLRAMEETDLDQAPSSPKEEGNRPPNMFDTEVFGFGKLLQAQSPLHASDASGIGGAGHSLHAAEEVSCSLDRAIIAEEELIYQLTHEDEIVQAGPPGI